MKKICSVFILVSLLISCKNNKQENSRGVVKKEINLKEVIIDTVSVRNHLYALAADSMQGRKPGTVGMQRATKYITDVYKKIGLKTYDTLQSYEQKFVHNGIEMSNIIGVLEGKSKKEEYVIVSAHHDHLGINENSKNTEDAIFNGANDDASGVVGVLELANYYAKKKINERSIIFVCFTAEEMGLVGSKYFGKNIDASKFIAGINLEMIGKTASFGPKTAWLTGFERSDFGKIVQQNLQGTGYVLHPDPYKKFNLFFRSDNASLAKLGVPSHTFSTSPITTDTDYHKASDEAHTLDVCVLAETVNAVAKGTESIITGKDTPTRIVLE